MENTKTNEEVLKIEDIRHSKDWAEYLKTLGWQNIKTKNNLNIAFLKLPFGKFAKLQRPLKITKEDLEEIDQLAKENKFLFIKIEPSISQDLQIFSTAKYRPSKAFMAPPSTLFINLQQPKEQLWKQISHSAKYSINRAIREGAKVEFIKNPSQEDLTKFYDLIKSTVKKKGFTTISLSTLIKKNKIYGDKTYLFLVYDKNSNLCGGKYYLGDKNNVWYMYGGTSDEGRKNKTGYFLVWDSFLKLKELGYKWLDFEGIDDKRLNYTSKWGGFAHFKEKFGGEKATYPFPQTKYYSRIFDFFAKITKQEI